MHVRYTRIDSFGHYKRPLPGKHAHVPIYLFLSIGLCRCICISLSVSLSLGFSLYVYVSPAASTASLTLPTSAYNARGGHGGPNDLQCQRSRCVRCRRGCGSSEDSRPALLMSRQRLLSSFEETAAKEARSTFSSRLIRNKHKHIKNPLQLCRPNHRAHNDHTD